MLPHIDLESTFGAIFVGIVVAIFLTGIATMQAWNYFRSYSDDRIAFKVTVILIYVADLAHTTLLVVMAYYYLIISFGDYPALQHLTPAWPASVFVGSMIALAAQTFSCVRIYYVTGRKAAALGCWLLVLLHMGFSDWLVVKIVQGLGIQSIQDISRKIARAPLVASLGLGAAADIYIAATLCLGMLRLSSCSDLDDFGMQRKKVIDRLIAFIVASGLLTSIAAVGELIAYLTMDNLIYLTFYTFTAKIYVNALLASLNERTHLRAEMQLIPESPKDKSRNARCDHRAVAFIREENGCRLACIPSRSANVKI